MRLTEVQKVQMGGGMYHPFRRAPVRMGPRPKRGFRDSDTPKRAEKRARD